MNPSSLIAEVRGFNKQTGTVTALASTEAVDRQGEIVEARAFTDDTLATYRKNPVILAGHQHVLPDGGVPVIGKALRVERRDGAGLEIEVEFAPAEVTPLGPAHRKAYELGFLSAFSIGFIPQETERQKIEEPLRHTKVDLLEISSVSVPSNYEALSRCAKSVGPAGRFAAAFQAACRDAVCGPDLAVLAASLAAADAELRGWLGLPAPTPPAPVAASSPFTAAQVRSVIPSPRAAEPLARVYAQYLTSDGDRFHPIGPTVLSEALAEHAYRVTSTMQGVAFERMRPKTDDLYLFKNSVMDRVLTEVDDFWGLADDYAKLGVLHHRGILLEGPPGTGKTSLLHQVAAMIVAQGDVVFFADSIGTLAAGLHAFRDVEPKRRVLVVIEDMDEHLGYEQHAALALLDGEDTFEGVLYLATTNYLDRFPPRLIRPGRFDRVVHVGPPPYEGRLVYLTHKLAKVEKAEEIMRLAKRTDGFSFGHLRELILAVYALKEPVEAALLRLSGDATTRVRSEDRAAARRKAALESLAENRGGFDETDTSFRYRVREPDTFQAGSLRTITLKEDAPKIQAVIGRPKGETTTAIQSLIFPKDAGWTMAEAETWVRAHADDIKGACDDEKGTANHSDGNTIPAHRDVTTEEDGENIYLTLAPLSAYVPESLRDVTLQGGAQSVIATIGILQDDADQPDLAVERITVLTFPKASGWTPTTAQDWLRRTDIEALLATALTAEDAEASEPPTTAPAGMEESARRIEAVAERIVQACEGMDARLTRLEQVVRADAPTHRTADVDIPGVRDDADHYARMLADLDATVLGVRGQDGNDGR